MYRFSLTLSVLGFFLLLLLQGNSIQAYEPSEDMLAVVVDVACDTDNGSDDPVLPSKKTNSTAEPVSAVVFAPLLSSELEHSASNSPIRAPPAVTV
ncbi:hypothetical protein [Oceanospirillum sanctuarii]|uniref:hypothetical protein n=1 Tax=Oceanospirillum sanctuarii TaxID=1434821 RepID=UPI000A3A67D4|nr:hypothetical protein [Oceanospirillum sanctuarii]